MTGKTRKFLLGIVIVFLTASSFPGKTETSLKDEIITRCRADMGEYGSAMVKACVDMDLEAAVALGKIPKKYKSILSRCLRDMREYGYAMVKACVDMDIEAEEALEKY